VPEKVGILNPRFNPRVSEVKDGKMGRPPKPTSEHKQDGTFHATKHGDRLDAQDHDLGAPIMPEGFSGQAQWLWNLIVENTPRGVLAALDTPKLIMACQWWERWRQYDQELADGDLTSKDEWTVMCKAAAASKRFTNIINSFPMDPIARTRIKVADGESLDENNPMADLIARIAERSN